MKNGSGNSGSAIRTEYEKVIKPETKPEKGEIKMGEVVKMVSDLTDGDAIIVTDVGQNQMYAARYYKYKNPNSLGDFRRNGNNGIWSSCRNRSQNRMSRQTGNYIPWRWRFPDDNAGTGNYSSV